MPHFVCIVFVFFHLVINPILLFVQYPCFNTSSESWFDPSDPNGTTDHKTEYISPHRSCWLSHLQSIEITYFGKSITFTESPPLGIPPHPLLTRAKATAQGNKGLMQEDVIYFNSKCKTRFSNSTPGEAITRPQKHILDWFRAVSLSGCLDSSPSQQILHLPDTFTSQWMGSHIVCCFVPIIIMRLWPIFIGTMHARLQGVAIKCWLSTRLSR